jgi:hypothetical protein
MAALPPIIVIRVVGIFAGALKAAVSEIKEAKAPDSDGGRKITRDEALEIVEVVFGSIIEDVVEILVGN